MHFRHGIVGVLWLGLVGCGGAEKAPPPVPEVTVQMPWRQDVNVERDFIGEIQASEEAEIRSKVTGRVLSVAFREGATVTRDQPLFRIDSDSLRASVNEARAGVAKAAADLALATKDAVRYKALVDKGTISRQQYDDAVARKAQAEAMAAAAKAQLEQAETQLRESAILSPYNGRIGRALVNVGALVMANQTLMATVSTTDTVRVDFALSEREYLEHVRPILESRQTRTHLPLKLLLADGSLYTETGTLTFADRAISAETGTFALSATFPNPHEVLRPGMFARVRAVVAQLPQAQLIPQRAVQEVLDKTFVSRVDANAVVVRQPVELGARIGADVVVKSGLSDQDQVIVEGHHKVRPGAAVKVVPTAPADRAANG